MNRSSLSARAKPCLACAGLLTLAACASVADAIRPSPVETAIMRYYEDHASELYGRCLNPYMDALTSLQVAEESATRLVVDARYAYRDRFMDGGEGFGVECAGFGERRFTLDRGDEGLRVVGMSGPGGEG